MNKPKVLKDYNKLDPNVLAQIKQHYPQGFESALITFKDAKGKYISALPFEGPEFYYLIRMTVTEAKEIIEEDDDYDENGELIELDLEEKQDSTSE